MDAEGNREREGGSGKKARAASHQGDVVVLAKDICQLSLCPGLTACTSRLKKDRSLGKLFGKPESPASIQPGAGTAAKSTRQGCQRRMAGEAGGLRYRPEVEGNQCGLRAVLL